jgi:beta-mannosidase
MTTARLPSGQTRRLFDSSFAGNGMTIHLRPRRKAWDWQIIKGGFFPRRPASGTTGLLAALLLFSGNALRAQVINFDVPGGESGGVNYSGQGACSDAGHNYWNPVVGNGTTGAGTNSDGATLSSITFTEAQSKNYEGDSPGTQGTPHALEYWWADASSLSVQTCALNNVPSGTYNLFLYGKNGDQNYADRGTIFTVSVGGTSYGSKSTVNSITSSFTAGNDYVEFSNIVVGQGGVITFTYTANTNVVRPSGSSDYSGTNNQGNFNGLQLADVSSSATLATVTNSSATGIRATSATLGGTVVSTGGSVPVVTIYYGPGNGGTNAAAWADSGSLGLASGDFSLVVSNLSPTTLYYFTAAAVNSVGTAWATPSESFATPAVALAQVSNLPASNITENAATLAANVLSTGGGATVVTIFCGTTDGATNALDWANSVDLGPQSGYGGQAVFNLSSNTTYYFTAQASNAAGVSWAAPSESFTTRAANPAPENAPAAPSICLSSGWQMQWASGVSDPGNVISQTNYQSPGWFQATVPGTVLTTLVNNGVYPEPLYGTNNDTIPDSLCLTGCWYRTVFNLPASYAGNRVCLSFAGINYAANVWINGSSAGTAQGAFARGIFDVTPYAKVGGENALAVLISPQPNPGTPHTNTTTYISDNGGVTASDGPTFLCSVGWNWLPTIHDRNTGIWQDVTVSGSGPVIIQNPYVTSQLPLPATNPAALTVQATLSNVTATAQSGMLAGVIGGIAFQQYFLLAPYATRTVTFNPANTPSLQISNPQLWWPNGYGPQNLYTLQLTALVDGLISDTNSVSFGIRQISYALPGSTNLALIVNGVPVIVKGGAWGMDEAMKRVPLARLDAQIHLHQQANFNLIRNWVGQSTSEDLFDLCDQYGIMLWDEFFQPNPSDGPDPNNVTLYLANVQDTILRFRNHPCIALWCGRNEGVPTPAAVELGDSNLVETLDPQRWYQASSTSGAGVSSGGPYDWQAPEDYYSVDVPFKTEIGCGVSVPTLEAIQAMMPSSDWEVINNDWADHDFLPGTQQGGVPYGYAYTIASRYGPYANLADFARKGQLANYEAHRAVFEGRLTELFQPVTGIINWMSHPSHPSFIYQLYGWDLEPNASLFGARKGCEPIHVMMNQNNWHLMVVNSTPQALSGLTVNTWVYNLDGSPRYAHTNTLAAAASTCTDLGAIAFPSGLSAVHFVKLQLFDSSNNLVSDNFYWRELVQDDLQALNTLPMVTLNVQATEQLNSSNCLLSVTLSNPAPVVALMTHLQLRQASSGLRVLPVFYSDNFVSLLPGETRTITLQAANSDLDGDLPLLTVDGWNVTVNPVASSANVAGVVPDTAAQAVNEIWPPATRINCGGSLIGFYEFLNSPNNWVGDTDYDTGSTTSTTATINTNSANAAPESVYQSERYGTSFAYTIPASGPNIVRLHFAEVKFGPGGREFNVTINGLQVLTNFDIAATGGESNAVVENFIAPANASSNVVIAFTTGAADLPKVCGIEIIPVTPVAPAGLSATPGNAKAALSWQTVSNAASYNVKRSMGSGLEVTITNVSNTGYTDMGLVNGTKYYYEVSAVNAGGESPNSTEVSVTPSAPSPFLITSFGVNRTALSISATNGPANGTYYLLSSTNIALPLSQWTPVLTNAFDSRGNLNLTTNIIDPSKAQGFYILQVP